MYSDTAEVLKDIQYIINSTTKEKLVIGVSGGVESTSALYILTKAIDPKRILPIIAPYGVDEEYPQAQSAAFYCGLKPLTINIRKSVDYLELQLRPIVKKRIFGNPTEHNVVERSRFNALAMVADYYDAAICIPTSQSKLYINKIPFHTIDSNIIFPFGSYTRTEMAQIAIQLGLKKELINTNPTSLEKELGFPLTVLDRYLAGVPGEPPRAIEIIERLHKGE